MTSQLQRGVVYDRTQHHFVVHTIRRSQLTQHCNALGHLRKNWKKPFSSHKPLVTYKAKYGLLLTLTLTLTLTSKSRDSNRQLAFSESSRLGNHRNGNILSTDHAYHVLWRQMYKNIKFFGWSDLHKCYIFEKLLNQAVGRCKHHVNRQNITQVMRNFVR